MINLRIVARILGSLAYLEALLMATSTIVGWLGKEEKLMGLIISTCISLTFAVIIHAYGSKAQNRMTRRDAYFAVAVTWLYFALWGTLPFILYGCEDGWNSSLPFAQAFFESMSGFTTTGATVLTGLDNMPHSLLLWRSMMHWTGGLGIVFFTIALLPSISGGTFSLFAAETTGLKLGKLHPRFSTTARWIWSIYILLTISCFVALQLCGMDIFDAVNHAMSTVASGGFSTHDASIGYYNSAAIEYVIIIFMFLAGVNFSLIYAFIFKFKFRQALKDSEMKLYLGLLFIIVAVGTSYFIFTGASWEISFRKVLFQTLSLQTTTGFLTDDFGQWPRLLWLFMFIAAIIGPMAGSTGGGIKCVRIITAYKMLACEVRHMLHPRAIIPLRVSGTALGGTAIRSVFAFFIAYITLMLLSVVVYSLLGLPLLDSFGVTFSLLGNIGPSIGHVIGSDGVMTSLPDIGLWWGSLLMLAGRLEIFAVLLPFVPDFWKED